MAFIVLPIRTESITRRTPLVNYILLGANVGIFLLLSETFAPPGVLAFKHNYLYLDARQPAFYQFFTYQFLHADMWHLVGNMLFLWLFGNGVNAKMGDLAYLLFYLGGGVFAGWTHAALHPQMLLGASGAIAAVTTAYLVLFPRSQVLVLVWLFLFIHFFEWPAMILIGLKIIVWDNILSPQIGPSDGIAYSAHLAGYFFGFTAALLMLLIRALPRDQFDILALWKRWYQRREFAAAMADPAARARAQFGTVANTAALDPKLREAHERRLDEISDLKSRISESLDQQNASAAAELYNELRAKDPQQCLSERYQLEIAREFYRTNRFEPAAAAFERFVECYPNSPEMANVQLLLGIIYARDLRQLETAEKHLSQSMDKLRDEQRRDQCIEWLKSVRSALGRPVPEM
jgi:membrane associated rhomboid family serine protease